MWLSLWFIFALDILWEIRPESAMGKNKETLSLTTAKIYHELIYTKTNFCWKDLKSLHIRITWIFLTEWTFLKQILVCISCGQDDLGRYTWNNKQNGDKLGKKWVWLVFRNASLRVPKYVMILFSKLEHIWKWRGSS